MTLANVCQGLDRNTILDIGTAVGLWWVWGWGWVWVCVRAGFLRPSRDACRRLSTQIDAHRRSVLSGPFLLFTCVSPA